MTKNSARKKAARAYQAAHPETTFPEAMRAVARSADPTSAVEETSLLQPSQSGADPKARHKAIEALTALALSTREDGSAIDFADELAGILASVTANVGSVERLLIGRTGSWESDLVAQLVNGTVMEEDLPRRRTAPVRVLLDVDQYWYNSGLEDVYIEDVDAIEQLLNHHADDREREQAPVDELDTIAELDDDDRTAHIAAWTRHAQEAARELGVEAPITVVVAEDTRAYTDIDPLADRIEQLAHARTPHPVVPELGTLVGSMKHPPEALAARIRAAGRSYRNRAASA
ncbi:MAG: hypothetical protein R2687_01360 [Candidatus Nanopelagicales bacterium]